MPKKIAFCFLIYDEVIHENLWEAFFNLADPEKYRIYVHYKVNKPSAFFDKYKLANCVETKYCHITICKAHNLLIEEALKDPDVYKTINLSQACIPLKSFEYVYNELTSKDASIFNKAFDHYNFPRCDPALRFLKRDEIKKSSNWFILNRAHAELCVNSLEYYEYFKDVWCPEEHFFITAVAIKDPAGAVVYTPNLADGATTFTNWHDMDYKFRSEDGLKNYSTISQGEVDYLLTRPCLFGRKFLKGCRVSSANGRQQPLSAYLRKKICPVV
jgi:hypothetical protein